MGFSGSDKKTTKTTSSKLVRSPSRGDFLRQRLLSQGVSAPLVEEFLRSVAEVKWNQQQRLGKKFVSYQLAGSHFTFLPATLTAAREHFVKKIPLRMYSSDGIEPWLIGPESRNPEEVFTVLFTPNGDALEDVKINGKWERRRLPGWLLDGEWDRKEKKTRAKKENSRPNYEDKFLFLEGKLKPSSTSEEIKEYPLQICWNTCRHTTKHCKNNDGQLSYGCGTGALWLQG